MEYFLIMFAPWTEKFPNSVFRRFTMSRIILILWAFAFASAADEEVQKLAAANREFTAASYKELAKSEPGNILLCGISAETVLSLLTQGARGTTESELHAVLSENKSSSNAYKQLAPKLKQDTESLTLLSANRIYVANGYEIEKSFKEIAGDAYKTEVQTVDFKQNSETADVINSWVAGETNNKITDLVDPDQLDSDTRLVLVNALYFKAKWLNPFLERLTENKLFHTSATESKQIEMMHLEETFGYKRCGYYKAQFLEMPFEGGDVTMTLVLPEAEDGLASFLTDLKGVFEVRDLKEERVSVTIPKFSIRKTTNFIPILKNLGVDTLFDTRANLTGIYPERGLYVDVVVQQTYINVNENGVEAAAATIGKASTYSVPPPPKAFFFHEMKKSRGVTKKMRLMLVPPTITFNDDHLLLINFTENSSGVILCVGKLQQLILNIMSLLRNKKYPFISLIIEKSIQGYGVTNIVHLQWRYRRMFNYSSSKA
ncbi:hypothetical protein JTB14_010896 [Gonioctena quinquepunctata]|nr:hypothetical protein JTB14_010896 [Gonioctena quinquepunctata]